MYCATDRLAVVATVDNLSRNQTMQTFSERFEKLPEKPEPIYLFRHVQFCTRPPRGRPTIRAAVNIAMKMASEQSEKEGWVELCMFLPSAIHILVTYVDGQRERGRENLQHAVRSELSRQAGEGLIEQQRMYI
jgi:hypothetical protein